MQNWKSFEYEIASILEGKRQPGSGLSPIASKKGDVITDTALIECKSTLKNAYLLTGKTFQKIVEQALNAQKIPVMAIQTVNGKFFVSLEADGIEPLKMKNVKGQTYSPYVSISSVFVPSGYILKTCISVTKTANTITYPVCIWQFRADDVNSFPRI